MKEPAALQRGHVVQVALAHRPDGLGAKAVVLLGLDAPGDERSRGFRHLPTRTGTSSLAADGTPPCEAPFMCRLTAPDVC